MCLYADIDRRYKSAIEILNDIADIDGNELDWRYTASENMRTWIKDAQDIGTLQN